jgi:hypothetical protein
VLYAASLAYLAAPLLWFAWRGRGKLRAALARPGEGALLAAWLVPLLVFALLSPVRRIGLHWLLSFVPALILTVALALERRALVITGRWFAGFAVLHAIVLAALVAMPLETWKGRRFYQNVVLLAHTEAVLQALPPGTPAYESYSMAAVMSFHAKRTVPVYGPGSSHARHDDIVTDWRTYQGRDLAILRRDEPVLAHYRPYFHEVEARRFEVRGAPFYAVLGRGFDYAAYREGVLKPVRERWYRIPRALPVGRCYFFERYGLQ